MKERRLWRRQAFVLVPANGVIDLAVAVLAHRHRHLVIAPMYGTLGLFLLVAYGRRWFWIPRLWDVVGLSVGLCLTLGFLLTEWLALR